MGDERVIKPSLLMDHNRLFTPLTPYSLTLSLHLSISLSHTFFLSVLSFFILSLLFLSLALLFSLAGRGRRRGCQSTSQTM